MSAQRPRRFASRPGDAEQWVRAAEHPATTAVAANPYTARLTIDITPDLRRRLKLAALQQGQTVADMLRALFEREYAEVAGGQP
ncbi:ribbon-helix-helix protein [Sphingomonas oligoaromativorans]|uniref:ribbon-helix-helix protein n=1 Tax=Sphingomonas oligoaromativorans TaxID=575322 RepID=UPI0014215192|nr:bacterioferritin (cytochrome b1) [Sphingomonas oligoaromativorans]